MNTRYDHFQVVLSGAEANLGTREQQRRAVIRAVMAARACRSLEVVEEHNGRLGEYGFRPESLGRIGWMTQLAFSSATLDAGGEVTERDSDAPTSDLCIGFFRESDVRAEGAPKIRDVTALFRKFVQIHSYTTLPFPVTINVSADSAALRLDVLMEASYCAREELRRHLLEQLASSAERRRGLLELITAEVNSDQFETVVFIAGNDGRIERLRPLLDGFEARALLIGIKRVPEDLDAKELEAALRRKLGESSGRVVGFVGWSLGAFLAYRLAAQSGMEAILLDPPHFDSRAVRRGVEVPDGDAAGVARGLTSAFASFDYEASKRQAPLRAFFSRDGGAGGFVGRFPGLLNHCRVLGGCDHESILRASAVRDAIHDLSMAASMGRGEKWARIRTSRRVS